MPRCRPPSCKAVFAIQLLAAAASMTPQALRPPRLASALGALRCPSPGLRASHPACSLLLLASHFGPVSPVSRASVLWSLCLGMGSAAGGSTPGERGGKLPPWSSPSLSVSLSSLVPTTNNAGAAAGMRARQHRTGALPPRRTGPGGRCLQDAGAGAVAAERL